MGRDAPPRFPFPAKRGIGGTGPIFRKVTWRKAEPQAFDDQSRCVGQVQHIGLLLKGSAVVSVLCAKREDWRPPSLCGCDFIYGEPIFVQFCEGN
jgi:hypothetical protein